MPFPDITFAPGTNLESLLDKLQRFFQPARKYWINLPEYRTIATATTPGRAGQWCYDANFIYVCVAADTWKRVAISAW